LDNWMYGVVAPPTAWHVGTAAAALATAAVRSIGVADTCAELVNDPNRPNTNPAIAMAAMSVMAIRITVARTGEIAFLLLLCFEILMAGDLLERSCECY